MSAKHTAKAATGGDQRATFDWVVERFPGALFGAVADDTLTLTSVSEGAVALLGRPPAELVGRSSLDWVHDQDRARLRSGLRALLEDGAAEPIELDYRVLVGDELRWIQQRTWVRRDDQGQALALEGFLVDISKPKALALAHAHFQAKRASERAVVMELATHPATDEGRFEVLARVVTERLCGVCEVDRASVWLLQGDNTQLELIDLFERGRRRHTQGVRLAAKDHPVYFDAMHSGRVIDAHVAQEDPRTREFIDSYLIPLGITSMLDAGIRVGGEIVGVVGLEQIGEIRRWQPHEIDFAAEVADQLTLALHNRGRREARERERGLQEQLLHSQKMDALGRLAGGIAHDFNNLLFAISASAELLDDQLEDPLLKATAEDILDASERASDLTKQLLAFSRRQPLARHDLDLCEAVAKLERMLDRLLGRGVTLEVTVPAEPILIRATEGLVQQLLTNLVVNARDAVRNDPEDPGHIDVSVEIAELREPLIIMSTPVDAGRYALLAVADDGCGMSEEIQAKVFEPFFTTKPSGKGTGLGLATVYGIAQRLGGTIKVASEVDCGSRFYVFLPLVSEVDANELSAP